MELLEQIEAFLAARNMKPSRFGLEALNDPRFVFDLREGKRDIKMSTGRRVARFMLEYVEPSKADASEAA